MQWNSGGHSFKANNTWIPLNTTYNWQSDREVAILTTHNHSSLQEIPAQSLDPLRLTVDQKPPRSGWQSDSSTEVSSGGFPHNGAKRWTFLETRKDVLQSITMICIYWHSNSYQGGVRETEEFWMMLTLIYVLPNWYMITTLARIYSQLIKCHNWFFVLITLVLWSVETDRHAGIQTCLIHDKRQLIKMFKVLYCGLLSTFLIKSRLTKIYHRDKYILRYI